MPQAVDNFFNDTMLSESYKQKLEGLKTRSAQEKFKTEMEVDRVNKSLNEDSKLPVKDLGKDEFLKLLITELQHQDPTNPMQDREFISQMAQFSSLEQMLNFNKSMGKLIENISFQSSYNLLGMNVEIDSSKNLDSSGNIQRIQGIVESIIKDNNETLVKVNGENYPVSSIINISK